MGCDGCESNMEAQKDEGRGPWSSSPPAPSSSVCYRSGLILFLLFFLIIGIFVGLVIGEPAHECWV